MPTALLVTADLGGNVPPLLGIAVELAHRGWTVHVHADERLRPRAEAAGLPFVLGSGKRYDVAVPLNPLTALPTVSAFFADRSRGRDAVAVARRLEADVVLVDTLLAGVVAECTAAGLTTIVLGHTIWEYLERGYTKSPVGMLMRMRGVDLVPTLLSADRMIIPTDARLDGPGPLPDNAVRVAPVLQERPSREAAPASRPRLLVSLSTNYFPGQQAVLQRVLAAVGPLPVDVVCTPGRAVDPARLRIPANTAVHPMLDHAEVLPSTDVLIGHGGHATTVRALAHGVPILVLPLFSMIDQPAIGRSVARSGAGLTLPKSSKPAVIRAAVRRLLDEPVFRSTAAAIAQDLAASDGAGAAADEIERVTAGRRARAASE